MGALAVVGPRVRIGARTVLHPHVVVYADAVIGADCLLHSGAQVRERLPARATAWSLQNGAVVGRRRLRLRPRRGAAGTTRSRRWGSWSSRTTWRSAPSPPWTGPPSTRRASAAGPRSTTSCRSGTRSRSARTRCSPARWASRAARSSAEGVTLAGQVGVAGHLEIGDGAIATGPTGIPADVRGGRGRVRLPRHREPGLAQVERRLRALPELLRRLRELERKVGRLAAGTRQERTPTARGSRSSRRGGGPSGPWRFTSTRSLRKRRSRSGSVGDEAQHVLVRELVQDLRVDGGELLGGAWGRTPARRSRPRAG